MSDDSLEPTLPDLLDALADTAAGVLDAGARAGWSPVGIYSALDAVDLLIAAARQYGGPLDQALEPVPGCTVAARAALRDPPPDPPRPRTNGARREEEDGDREVPGLAGRPVTHLAGGGACGDRRAGGVRPGRLQGEAGPTGGSGGVPGNAAGTGRHAGSRRRPAVSAGPRWADGHATR